AAAVVTSLSDIRRWPDETPAGAGGRRGSGDRTTFMAEPETVSRLRTSRPARLLLRGAVANHRSYRRIAASADADPLCPIGCIGRSWWGLAEAATHAQSGRTYAGRQYGLRKAAGVSRTWDFATIARR